MAKVIARHTHGGDTRRRAGLDGDLAARNHGIGMQPPQPPKGRKAPVFLPPGRDREFRPLRMQSRDRGRGFHGPLERAHQPTAPSIWSSISRFSSSAYSMGSSRAIGSTKPRTIVAAASSSVMPRLIR